MLDSYDAERRPVGLHIVNRTAARMNRVLEGDVDEQEPIRDDSQLFLNYRESRWVADDADLPAETGGPLAGDRAPDVVGLRRGNVRHELRLFDLLRGRHHTLLLSASNEHGDSDCRRFHQMAAALGDRYGSRVHIHAVLSADCQPPPVEGLSLVVDARGDFARQYGPQRTSAYLIRPDGYVGYRAHTADPQRIQDYLRRVLTQ